MSNKWQFSFEEKLHFILKIRFLCFSLIHKIYDIIIDITAFWKICFLLLLLNAIEYRGEIWWNISITY